MTVVGMKVLGMPAYAHDFPYVVVRYVDDKFQFWGAYDSLERAGASAVDVGGWVVTQ